jgi:putative ABC transport system permease protein
MLQNLGCDIRLAWRSLFRSKPFSLAAGLTLALGITGTTVMFAMVEGVLLRPMPVRDQERLIVAWKELPSSGLTHHDFGGAEIEAVRDASQLLEAVAGSWDSAGRDIITEDGTAAYVMSAAVTGGFFDVLGAAPVLGRALTRADDVEGAEPVLAISHALWTRRYGRSPDVVGRRVTLGEGRFTIVGVMPDLDYPIGVEMWRTTRSFSATGPFGDAARQEIDLLGRLRTGVTIEQAAGELAGLTRRLESVVRPTGTRGLVPVVRPFAEAIVGSVRPAMLMLMAAVGLLMLIASANVANLLLMRGEGRRAELALREALGAGRARIVRQLLLENFVLAVFAGALGLAASWWSLQALLALLPDGLPRVDSVRINVTVVAFTAAVGLFAAVLAGLAPALSLARGDLLLHLRGSARGVTTAGSPRARRALVVAQVALAVTIVAAAGLLTRSVLKMQSVDIGVAADRLVLVELSMPGGKYSDPARHGQFLDAAVAQLEATPEIAAATPVNVPPFSGDNGWDVPKFTVEGQSAERAAANPSLNLESIYPNYFATFDIPLAHGRAFTTADRGGTLRVAILSEDVASATWPGEDPTGKRIKLGGPQSPEPWLTVVGVAGMTRYRELARPRPTLYLPAAQFLITAQMLVLRTSAPDTAVASVVRDRVNGVDPAVGVPRVAPFARLLDEPLARPRFNALLLSLFGLAALLLATVGLYAVMAAYVRQRDRELALRRALGATAAHMRRLVLGEAVSLAGLGAAIGLAGATAATRLVRGMLFQIEALDPPTLLGAAVLLMAAAAVAAYVPMRRATGADAVALLRN